MEVCGGWYARSARGQNKKAQRSRMPSATLSCPSGDVGDGYGVLGLQHLCALCAVDRHIRCLRVCVAHSAFLQSVEPRKVLIRGIGPRVVDTGPKMTVSGDMFVEFEPLCVVSAPSLAESGRSRANFGRLRAEFGRHRAKHGRLRPNVGRSWPSSVQHRSTSSRMRPLSARHRSNPAQVRTSFVEIGHAGSRRQCRRTSVTGRKRREEFWSANCGPLRCLGWRVRARANVGPISAMFGPKWPGHATGVAYDSGV